jgi:hypothetical protein
MLTAKLADLEAKNKTEWRAIACPLLTLKKPGMQEEPRKEGQRLGILCNLVSRRLGVLRGKRFLVVLPASTSDF